MRRWSDARRCKKPHHVVTMTVVVVTLLLVVVVMTMVVVVVTMTMTTMLAALCSLPLTASQWPEWSSSFL